MKEKTIILLLIFFSFNASLAAQKRKQFHIKRSSIAPKIDAQLSDSTWLQAASIEDFIQQSPFNGDKPSERTIVKMAYDDDALYIGAQLFDSQANQILTEYGIRDAGDQLNADLFSVELNPWNDSRTAVEFMVSASGIQMDSRNTIHAMNKAWDAVWESEVKLYDWGWAVEMKIPYSALRFPKSDIQTWEVNFFRLIKRKNEGITWNFVDKNVYGWLNQAGELHGIKNIEPHTRLSFTPYLSTYLEKESNESFSTALKGGLDVKYGINESFTLDMMLIPDFGQVESDDHLLNLGPFETFYDEKRSFFTEGMELFSKGNIFYSRRLGGTPIRKNEVWNQLSENEIVSDNPNETQLLNATKLSGRTNKGLGIGFINAMNSNEYASIKDTVSGNKRKFLTQGFSNYNMLVLDQSFGNQSFLSFANTNVVSNRSDFKSNVTATEFKFTNKAESYALSGNAAISNVKNFEDKETGYRYYLQFSRIKGKFQFDLIHTITDEKFDPNAMGYLEKNNEFTNLLRFKYNLYQPFGIFNELTNMLQVVQNNLYSPNEFASLELYWNTNAVFKNYSSLTFESSFTPVPKYDFYEPRIEGWKYKEPIDYWFSLTHRTDTRKNLALQTKIAYWRGTTFNKESYWIEFTPQWRLGDKLFLSHEFAFQSNKNSLGFADTNADASEIYFVNRDINTISNTFEGRWIFNRKSSLSLRARHYWSEVEHKESYLLRRNGTMNPDTDYSNQNHINYNAFTVNLAYNWEFAPGSNLSLVWKNNIQASNSRVDQNYFDNLADILESDQFNSISLRLLYYLDFHQLKKKLK
ncbi:DUF5916 domain-containing protein [Marinifilum caeruleilacunae]|uniref:Hydrolase n=1 Tax=Marinifilum caeruleilacunae TaxID=2499076 RepID=A0ABX1WRD8_9BACT|nr:DUF5916 domain-containing protein [Marinifilum caeruleilacunae]NOU58535.1 hypothetical protein [Marinifilum caeruleilacunae]